jgi:hypothetical protein
VLAACSTLLVGYGTWRRRGLTTVQKYMLAGNSMRWYAIAFPIMATQVSAISCDAVSLGSFIEAVDITGSLFYAGLLGRERS